MNEQELSADEMYFLDGVGAIDQGKISFTEIRRVEHEQTFGGNREARRRARRVARKRGKGFTR